MPIKTVDTRALAEQTGNLYESIVVLSRRARQVASQTKAELDQRLSHFEDLSLDPAEELRSNEDQLRVSLEFEKRPKSTDTSIDEMEQGELYFRNPSADADGGF